MWFIVGGVILYVVGCYIIMYKDLSRNAGPCGLGWLAFVLAPVMGPIYIGAAIQAFFRRIFS